MESINRVMMGLCSVMRFAVQLKNAEAGIGCWIFTAVPKGQNLWKSSSRVCTVCKYVCTGENRNENYLQEQKGIRGLLEIEFANKK